MTFITGHRGHACRNHAPLRLSLIAHHLNGFCTGANKYQPCRFNGLGKGGIFTEKAITGMNGFSAASCSSLKNSFSQQVGLAHRARTNAYSLISKLHMRRASIGIGIDRNSSVAQLFGGANNPTGNLAAVGN